MSKKKEENCLLKDLLTKFNALTPVVTNSNANIHQSAPCNVCIVA